MRYASRADEPVWFWLHVSGHIALLIFMCWLAFPVATSWPVTEVRFPSIADLRDRPLDGGVRSRVTVFSGKG